MLAFVVGGACALNGPVFVSTLISIRKHTGVRSARLLATRAARPQEWANVAISSCVSETRSLGSARVRRLAAWLAWRPRTKMD